MIWYTVSVSGRKSTNLLDQTLDINSNFFCKPIECEIVGGVQFILESNCDTDTITVLIICPGERFFGIHNLKQLIGVLSEL